MSRLSGSDNKIGNVEVEKVVKCNVLSIRCQFHQCLTLAFFCTNVFFLVTFWHPVLINRAQYKSLLHFQGGGGVSVKKSLLGQHAAVKKQKKIFVSKEKSFDNTF